MAKKLLITVHGINTLGEWQETVVGTLSKHFTCETIKYSGYRYFGFLRNCISFWLITLLIAGYVIFSHWSEKTGMTVMAASLPLSLFLAVSKRARAVKSIGRRYDAATGLHRDSSPHVIAHSFGTYLVCAALKKHAGSMAFDRIVFFGSVVNVRYPWVEVIAKGGVRGVRNETGSQDYVVRLARWAFWIRDMGNSGVRGFLPNPPRVENVPFSFNHSDAAELRKHLLETWLPFLWDIPPPEYRDLLRQSADCLGTISPNSVGQLDAFAGFDNAIWSWAWTGDPQAKMRFRTFMEAQLEEFCRLHGKSWMVGMPQFNNAYALARYLFWGLCETRDDHPRFMAIRAAEQAAGVLFR